jgi:dTDP-4-dehydrorhamnose reductase
MMRILITGKSGQLSQSLQMLGGTHEIITIGRPQTDFENPFNLGEEIIKAAPDIVVSAAAYTMVDKAEAETEKAKTINADAPEIIAISCKNLQIPLIHISTDYVYDGSKTSPYKETDTPSPLGIYGKTKLAGEDNVVKNTDDFVILRTSWVYSPFGNNFVKTMLNLGAAKDEISVVDDQRGNPTSALEIARAVIKIAEKLKKDTSPQLRGVFHLAGSGETSWAGFAEEIFKMAKLKTAVKKINTEQYPTPAKRPANSRLDCSKLSQIYSIRLPLWQDSLKECLEIFLKTGD